MFKIHLPACLRFPSRRQILRAAYELGHERRICNDLEGIRRQLCFRLAKMNELSKAGLPEQERCTGDLVVFAARLDEVKRLLAEAQSLVSKALIRQRYEAARRLVQVRHDMDAYERARLS
ncbi:MAG TPA: hypothetical protein PL112_20845, partial [Candidatus Obscuribacter sp.]|nr:hypothetical protein [Candidatus Obscuribacter sp.]